MHAAAPTNLDRLHTGLVLLATALLICCAGARAEIITLTEDFGSWQHRDAAFTTARWDTLGGQLTLHPVGLDSLGHASGGGLVYTSAMGGGNLYLGDGNGYLFSLDPSDPTDPLLLDSLATLSGVRDVVVDGTWAYLSVGTAGIQAINLADPGDLVAGGSASLDGFAYGMAQGGAWLYAAQSGAGLAVVDVSTPWSPTLAASIPTRDWARDVARADDLLLVADSASGLTIMSLATPATPVQLGTHQSAASCWAVAAGPGRAYLALGTAGLEIVDISDPQAPLKLGSLTLPGNVNCRHLSAVGDSLYAAGNDGGLFIVDISDPALPEVVGNFNSPGAAYHTTVDGTTIWLADGTGGAFSLTLDPLALDQSRNLARSLNLADAEEPVVRVRLSATTTDSVRFDVTGDGGGTWWPADNDGDWVTFAEPGPDLRWRATLVVTEAGDYPSCSELVLTVDRLQGYGAINSVEDIPGDTGGQVRVSWDASRYDSAGADHTVTEYSLYRRYALDGAAARFPDGMDKGAQPDLTYPPGSWDYLLSVPADRETSYSVVAPTLADSSTATGTAWSVFFVRARTTEAGLYFDSPPDSGYSVDNLRPAAPTGFRVDYTEPEGARLEWHPSPEPDFAHFRLYRGTTAGVQPLPANLFLVTGATSYVDPDPGLWHYCLTVVDLTGHESEPAAAASPAPLDGPGLALLPNQPNPFNPRTTLRLHVPAGGQQVSLSVYDVQGRLVRRLVQGYLEQGTHQVIWDGKDGQGRAASSGVYHARLEGGKSPRVVKMLLLR